MRRSAGWRFAAAAGYNARAAGLPVLDREAAGTHFRSGGEDRPSFAHAPAPRRVPEKLPMNPILLFLLTTAGAFLLHIVMIFVLVGKKK